MNKNNDNNNNDDLPLFTTILELFGPLKSIGNYVCFICFIYIYIYMYMFYFSEHL